MSCPTTLTELYDALARHDWFYPFSDDQRVYFAGERNVDRLLSAAQAIPGGVDLMTAYGRAICTHSPRPPRPAPIAEAA